MAITLAPKDDVLAVQHRAVEFGRASPKVLVASSSFPYPLDIGRKVVIAGFLDYLASVYGDANVTFAYIGSSAEGGSISPLLCHSVPLALDGTASRLRRVAWHSILRRNYALQETLLYSQQAEAQLQELARTLRPDLVVVDTVRMARYFETAAYRPQRSVLYLDDLYSLRYQRMIETVQTHPDMTLDAIGTFGRFLPAGLRRAAQGRTLQRGLLAFESRLLEKREIEVTGRFDSILLLNEQETVHLAQRSGTKNIRTIKPLLRAHRGRLPRRFDGTPTYLFLGNLRYPANAYSLSLLMTQAMPKLIKADRRTKLLVIGRQAGTGLAEQAQRLAPHVEFLDYVEDLAPVMATAAAMVVPLVYGSGLKMKVLDALYYGVPIVSTDCGVDSIPVTPGRNGIIENTLSEFVEPLIRLLDRDLNRHISEEAQRLYAEEFAPEIVWREYGATFGSA